MRFLIIVMAVALAAPGTVSARTIDATDPAMILEVARGFGSAELTEDTVGDPLVNGRIEGVKYSIFFYDCTEGQSCRTLMFRSTWAADVSSVDRVNEWNRENRFGRAYVDEDGEIVLEMDVNLFAGVTFDNFDDTVDWWRFAMTSFEDFYFGE